MKDESDRFNFERQRKEVGLGGDDSKNKAKKTGKSLSAEAANPADFFEQYQYTLVKNREVEWLNGERDSPDPKVKKPNQAAKEHQLPAFWKKEEKNLPYQPSLNQKQEVTSVVSSRESNQVGQPPRQNAGVQNGMKMFNKLLGQNALTPIVQTPKKEAATSVETKTKADDESSHSTPRFNEQRSGNQPNPQPGVHAPSNLQTGSIIQSPNPLSRLSSNTNTILNNSANTIKPTNIFMGTSQTTNSNINNQINVAGHNKQTANGLAPKIATLNQGRIFNPQAFGMMKTVKLSQQKENPVEAPKSASYRKLVERCSRYREKIRQMVKSSAEEREKLIDIVTLMTIDHPEPLEKEQIISKSEDLISLYEQMQEAKKNKGKFNNYINNADDTLFAGFNLNDYLANSSQFKVKKIAEVPEEMMSQIKSYSIISKLYSKVENMSYEQFAHKFSKMIEKVKSDMVASIEKCMLLLNSKRQAEALALRCEQEQENLRKKSQFIQRQLEKIEKKEKYCRQFFEECCRYLDVQSPQDLPKQELNYHLDSLQELSESSRKLKIQLKKLRALLNPISQGEPHRTITSHFCSFSSTLVDLLPELQALTKPA